MATRDPWVLEKPAEYPTPTIAISPPKENAVMFYCGGEETLRVARDGFYVRGVKVPADDKEAEEVYNAFKQWMVWQGLTSNSQ